MKMKTLVIVVMSLTLPYLAQAQVKTKITKAEAEHAALAQVKGGRVLSAEYEHESGKSIWSLDIKTPTGIREVWVDPTSGMVIRNDAETKAKEKMEKASEKRASKITKAEAEEIALKAVPGGKVLEAELESESGMHIWSLDVKSGKEIKEVWISPANGKVLKVTVESAKKEKQEKEGGMNMKKSTK